MMRSPLLCRCGCQGATDDPTDWEGEGEMRARRVARRGATMVEYAIMLGLIAVVSILVVAALGHSVWHTYDAANTPINEVTAQTPDPGDTGGTTPPAPPAPHNHGKRPPTHPGNPGLGNGGNDKAVGNAPGGGK